MLTEAEVKLAAYAYAIRAGEEDEPLWFAPAAPAFVEAVRLHERGLLDREWSSANSEHLYRYSDAAVKAQALTAMMTDHARNTN